MGSDQLQHVLTLFRRWDPIAQSPGGPLIPAKYLKMASIPGAPTLRLLTPPLLSSAYKGQAGKIGVLGGCAEYTGGAAAADSNLGSS